MNYNQVFEKMIEKPEHREIIQYFLGEVKPIYAQLLESIIKEKPEDIPDYCLTWFKAKRTENDDPMSDDEDVYDNQIDIISDQQFFKMRQEKLAKARKKRVGFSSQVYGHCGKRVSIKVSKGFKKQENAQMNILFFCMNSFLFRNFSEKEVSNLITMMGQKNTISNQIIFKEGEQGDSIYFVFEGIFECYRQTETGPETLRYYHKGDTFGEICLLHAIKRQASIISRSDGILFTLDRQSYIHYKKMCITKRRNLYIETLKKQSLFHGFDENELEKVCDVLVEATYEEYEVVINEGDSGRKFYIIIDGILVAYKGKQENIIQCYKEGDAFGEIALIKEMPRQASVKALTRCRLVYMTSEAFNRIFENIDLSKEVEQKYFSNKNSSGFINMKRRQ